MIVFLFSNPFIFNEFSRAWENSIPNTISKTDTFSVAIVLGGISSYDMNRDQIVFHESSERLMNVLPLYFNGQVKKILFAGGSGNLNQKVKEADHIKKYLLAVGVKQSDLLLDSLSRNTFENAKYSVEILKEQGITSGILLSTSATHMTRSLLCFEKLGVSVTPFPVDYVSNKESSFSLVGFIVPKPSIMMRWYWLIHEWLGIVSYKLAGYA